MVTAVPIRCICGSLSIIRKYPILKNKKGLEDIMVSRIIPIALSRVFVCSQAIADDYASPPIFLKADQVLPAGALKGENFSVDHEVRNDGLINFYMLDTNYRRLSAESTAELEVRIEELNALTIMEEMDRKNVFKESLVTGVKGVGEGVKNLVTMPIDTTKEMVKGTGQFISNIGQAFVSDDPSQDNALKVALGYDVAKRQFAYEFGINPYTDYEPAVARLGEIARAAVAGGLTPKVALAAIDHPVATGRRSGNDQGPRTGGFPHLRRPGHGKIDRPLLPANGTDDGWV